MQGGGATMTISAASANLIRAALDSLADPCGVLRPIRDDHGAPIDFVWSDANLAACSFFGVSHAELVGLRVAQTAPGRGAAALYAEMIRSLETGALVEVADFEYVAADSPVLFERLDLRIVPTEGHLVVSWRDSSREHRQASALEEADRRFRILAQHTSDVVIDCQLDGTIIWVSPSVEKALGFLPEQWLGRKPRDLVVLEDRDLMLDIRERVFSSGASARPVEMRFLDAAGDARWMTLRAQAYADAGSIGGAVIELRDVHEEVLVRRAATTLSASNAILVRAADERELLAAMCEVAVGEAGYLFCWYGRPIDDEDQSVRAVASSVVHRDYLDTVKVSWGEGPLGRGPAGTCLRTGEPAIVNDFLVADAYRPWHAQAAAQGFRSSLSLPVYVHGHLDGAFMVYAAEPMAFDDHAVSVMKDLASQVGYGIGRIRDAGKLAKAVEDRRLLGTAIDQAAEAIVVTDEEAVIRYANPAALRISGYEMHEVLGQNPSVFQSGLHDARFYEDMWHRLLGGQAWHGVLMNRRKDGEIYEEEATIAPVHDDDGRRIAYVAVKHDLSRERELQEVVQRDQSDRDAIVEVMRDVRPGDSLESTAASLGAAVRRFEHIDGCMVVLLTADGAALPVAIAGAAVPELQSVGTPLHNDKLSLMVDISRAGPWWMDLRDASGIAATDPEFREAMLQHGFTATAYAPIRWEGETIGVVSVVTSSPVAEQWMPLRLGVLTEIGSFAGMLLGPQAAQHARREALRGEIAEIIADEAFRIVFEPVVHLPSGAVIGYEALTRFTDGEPPDRRFDAAQAVGLGSALESACASRALVESASLPDHVWLSVNFSPASIVDGAAAAVVAGATRQVIIEITEHNAIENYAAVRRAISECGNVLVAVDDAGSGFASLRHILELEPDIIKLDIALVRDIDTDPARQALAAGMRHFAALTGTTLIAEGVETESEARSIRQLGVELAQGYLFATDDGPTIAP
jgi:PAS domain S-box-containing protein